MKAVVALALCAVVAVGCGGAPGARQTAGTPADLAAMAADFEAATDDVCPVTVIGGSARFAVETASGHRWAMASVVASPPCSGLRPFGRLTVTAVFDAPPGHPWEADAPESTPWPCPPGAGQTFGPSLSTVPLPVLRAWHLAYADGCERVSQPELSPH